MSLPDLRDPSVEAGSSNPYAPPSAPLEDAPQVGQGLELADRGTRFGAQFCDGFITGIPAMAAIFASGLIMGRWFPVYVRTGVSAQWVLGLVGVAAYLAVFFLINGWLLKTRGQTVGKRICGIRIARPDGTVPGLSQTFGRRIAVFSIPGLITGPFAIPLAYVIQLADVLCIFRSSRKCLHDDVAGTIVVKA